MTSELTYRTHGDLGEISALRQRGHRLIIGLPGYSSGYLVIGDFSVKISDGKAELDCRLMKDGEYRPTLITGGRQIRLERFGIESGRPKILPTEESTLRDLLCRTAALEEALLSAERTLSEIKNKLACDTVF